MPTKRQVFHRRGKWNGPSRSQRSTVAAAEQLILLPPEKASDRSSIVLSLHRDGAMKIGLIDRRPKNVQAPLPGRNVARVKFIVSTRVTETVR